MSLHRNPQITITSAYALTESARLESKDSFCDELHTVISSIPVRYCPWGFLCTYWKNFS